MTEADEVFENLTNALDRAISGDLPAIMVSLRALRTLIIIREVDMLTLGDRSRRIRELELELRRTIDCFMSAIYLLEQGGKNAAESDKMFETMMADFRGRVFVARAMLKEP